ncbi:MAG: DUF4810 domain-containing protein [Magnetococcales bacterium]|nr:DUF4810 domain-containing protein [Magnetococcales bacterium]
MKSAALALLALSLLSGCATHHEPLYHWGTLPDASLKRVREPGDNSLSAYEKTLLETIEQAKQLNKTVPPGVYCELGYLRFKQGRVDEAMLHYNAEIALYPEAQPFVERLKEKVKELLKSRSST